MHSNQDEQEENGMPIIVGKESMHGIMTADVVPAKGVEPYAIKRDESIKLFLEKKNISFNSFKDQVIFETDEVVKDDGNPYKVYTPYSRKWIEKLNASYST